MPGHTHGGLHGNYYYHKKYHYIQVPGFIQIRSVVLGIHHSESCFYYELFYYAQSYAPLLSLFY